MTSTQRTIVIGAAGQVGSALMAELGNDGIGISRRDADIGNRAEFVRALSAVGPTRLLINAAAYNDVDRAESERERAFAINAEAPKWAATWAAERNIPFVHYSTDYVFSDGSGTAWSEGDRPVPLNVYGESKLAGELAVQKVHGKNLILRTSWVYGNGSKNFVRRVLERAKDGDALTMVSDQIGSPTYAPALAHATLNIANDFSRFASVSQGVLHLAGGGSIGRAEFAREIVRVGVAEGVLAREVPIRETTTAEQYSAARRPTYCALDCSLGESLGVGLPLWRESLPLAVRAALR